MTANLLTLPPTDVSKMKVAFDLDGTIAEQWWPQLDSAGQTIYLESDPAMPASWPIHTFLANQVNLRLLVKPPLFIITSRPLGYFPATSSWLNQHKMTPCSLSMPDRHLISDDERAAFKAQMIVQEKIELYFEDEKELRQKMKRMLASVNHVCLILPASTNVIRSMIARGLQAGLPKK